MKTNAQILAESLNSFRSSIAKLESDLSFPVLIGSPYMLVIKAEGFDFELVYGAFGANGQYECNAPHSFRSLNMIADHLCGVSCYSPESANKNCAVLRSEGVLTDGHKIVSVEMRHIRDEKQRRLVRAREMVATLEKIAA